MRRIRLLICCVVLVLPPATPAPAAGPAGASLNIVDGYGRTREERGLTRDELEVGSTLFVSARGLQPRHLYEFRLAAGREAAESPQRAVSFARVGTDGEGRVAPLALWYDTGVAGCSQHVREGDRLPPYTYRKVEEAERDLQGKAFTVSVHAVEDDPSGTSPPLKLRAGEALMTQEMTVVPRRHPLLYPCDRDGCGRNSMRVGEGDLYVAGANFRPGEDLEILVVPHQAEWRVDDALQDVTGKHSSAESKRARADDSGRFLVKVWDRGTQRRGVFDQVVRRGPARNQPVPRAAQGDLVFNPNEPGFIFYDTYPAGGQTVDLAGRPTGRAPYFQLTHGFGLNDQVWAHLDPTFVPEGHPGARYAAFYVVKHRDAAPWARDGAEPGPLADVSGGVEIVPVKAGSIAATDVPVWNPPLPAGNYDVVVDFGVNPGETEAASLPDGRPNARADFLNGADEYGFVVAEDPGEPGRTPVGMAVYSRPKFIRGEDLGDRGYDRDVDLRAIVCYPARSAGRDPEVADGRHPLFVIEHGNHRTGVNSYLGYMGLLRLLASHGIIAVSIDADDLARSDMYAIEERGDLILKHLEFWSHANDPATFADYPELLGGRFRGHVDLSRVGVSGHSRGGEASVAAYARNRNPAFRIIAVSSIAPVDAVGYNISGVPYFVILPAADGDVVDLDGLRIYDRVRPGGSGDGLDKSAIYVYGANHNYFNSVWARDGDNVGRPGDDGDESWHYYGTAEHPALGDRDDYIDKDDQQRLGEAYVAAFNRLYLNGETVYRDMFRGLLTFRSTAGFKVYPMHQESYRAELEDGRGRGAAAEGVGAAPVVLDPRHGSPHEATALRVEWEGSDGHLAYEIPSGQGLAPTDVIAFRVAQTNADLNPRALGQDFKVELLEGGTVRATYVGRFDAIPVPYRRWDVDPRTGKPVPYSYNVMTLVRIPVQSFTLNQRGQSLQGVTALRFHFSRPDQGEIYVSNIDICR